MCKYLVATICLLIMPGIAGAAGPTHEVFQQIGALAVNYDVETNALKTVLYVTNHGDAEILCDASMTTNKQEQNRNPETLVAPQKTVGFKFKHRASIKNIKIYLVCEPAVASSETKSTATDNKTSSDSKDDGRKKSLTDKPATPPETKQVSIPVEDLENP